MNILKILFLLLVTQQISLAQEPYITTWENTSGTVIIRTKTTLAYSYNYDVDWENDGVFDTIGVTGNISHDYGGPGTYTIAIRGEFPHHYSNGAHSGLVSIDQWGDIQWKSMEASYKGCDDLISIAMDTPDLSQVTTMFDMFYGCSNLNVDLNHWDVSTIVNMNRTFTNASKFNGNIGDWDVSSVTVFTAMFANALKFNQDIGDWNPTSAIFMEQMFSSAFEFNKDIRSWDVSSVINMKDMFFQASDFNQDLTNWDVSSVTNMWGMFERARDFNGDLSGWDVSSVKNMFQMFSGAYDFNQSLNNWDVSSVTTMQNMFDGTRSFNGNISNWDVSSVTNMSSMFGSARIFNRDISGWDVSSVSSFSSMFANAFNFNQDLGNWNLSQASTLSTQFSFGAMSTINYDKTLIGWASQSNIPSNLKIGASGRFCEGASARDSLIINHGWTFSGFSSSGCEDYYFTTVWNTSNPGVSNSQSIKISTDSNYSYNYDIDWNNDFIFDDLNVTGDITHDFGAPGFRTINIRGVFPAIKLFNQDAPKLISIKNWGAISWKDMSYSFAGTNAMNFLSLNSPPNLDSTSNLEFMFYNSGLRGAASMNYWDVSNITNMKSMFEGAINFNDFNFTIEDWNVSNVTTMNNMFKAVPEFSMDLNKWDVSSLISADSMFYNTPLFNQDLADWNISNVEYMKGMLSFSGLDSANYDATLNSWADQAVNNNIQLGAHGLTFCEGTIGRNSLMLNSNWEFIGDSMTCAPCLSTDTNIWVGPAVGNWYDDMQNWSTGRFPVLCDKVVIPANKYVSIQTNNFAEVFSIDVQPGARFNAPLNTILYCRNE